MKKKSIKAHLSKYSISRKRGTTINHAFASAIAPFDSYDEQRVSEALVFLGQNPEDDLLCVFCENKAQTWDHLVSLVKGGELHGFGHQLGNLVPCCKDCNSSKGAKDFSLFIKDFPGIKADRAALTDRLRLYSKRFAKPLDIKLLENRVPEKWSRYIQIKKEVIALLVEADEIADALREKVVE